MRICVGCILGGVLSFDSQSGKRGEVRRGQERRESRIQYKENEHPRGENV